LENLIGLFLWHPLETYIWHSPSQIIKFYELCIFYQVGKRFAQIKIILYNKRKFIKFGKNIKLQQMYCIILYQLITSNTLGTEFPLLKYFLYRFVHENVHICNQSQQPYILVIDDHSLSDYQATQLLLTRTQSFYLILCL